MPRTLHVHADPALIPDRAALQARLRTLGWKLSVDEAYAPFVDCQYLPCTLDGEDAGVALAFERDVAWPEALAARPAAGRSTRLTLRWGGDPREQLSAVMLAAAVAEAAGGAVLDPDRGAALDLDALRRQARRLLEELF